MPLAVRMSRRRRRLIGLATQWRLCRPNGIAATLVSASPANWPLGLWRASRHPGSAAYVVRVVAIAFGRADATPPDLKSDAFASGWPSLAGAG